MRVGLLGWDLIGERSLRGPEHPKLDTIEARAVITLTVMGDVDFSVLLLGP